MHPSLREKSDFYHGLARLLDSGASIQAALKTLRTGASSNLRKFISVLEHAIESGKTLGDAFATAKPSVNQMEVSVMQAGERSGRRTVCCRYLSEYFARLAAVRAILWKKSAYPLFIFHFAVLMMALPSLFTGGGVVGAAGYVLGTFALVYGVGFLIFALGKWWLRSAGKSETADRLLRALPLFGNTRKSLTAARFCGTYEMQLQAGVNMVDALRSAAQASQSAIFIQTIRRIQDGLLAGQKAGDLLEREPAFPRRMVQGIRLGEETGYLDQELERMTKEYEEKAVHWLEAMGEWLPRMIYLFVVLYSAWQVVSMYLGMAKQVQNVLNF